MDKVQEEKLRKQIRPDFDPVFFDRANKFVEFIHLPQLLFDGIKIGGIENLINVKDKQLFYVSNHVSMADFLVLPYVLWKNKLPIPSIIAGKNLFKFLFKTIWKKSGAIALDRKGGREYLEIFQEETKKALLNGISIVDFAEAGRNYSGIGLNKFKTGIFGMVSDIVEEGKDIYGVSVSLHYDKRPEQWALPYIQWCKKKRDENLKTGNKLRAEIYDYSYFAFDVAAYFVRPFVKEKGNGYLKFEETFSIKDFIKNIDNKKKFFLASKFQTQINHLMSSQSDS